MTCGWPGRLSTLSASGKEFTSEHICSKRVAMIVATNIHDGENMVGRIEDVCERERDQAIVIAELK